MKIDLKNCAFFLVDGKSGTSNFIKFQLGEGNCQWNEKKNREYTKDRGQLDEVRDGDEEPMDVSFEFKYEYIKGSTGAPSVEDVLKKEGEAASWTSSDTSDAGVCRPYCVDVVIIHSPQPVSCGQAEKVTLPYFRYETLNHDPKAGTVSCSGKCNCVAAIRERVTNTTTVLDSPGVTRSST